MTSHPAPEAIGASMSAFLGLKPLKRADFLRDAEVRAALSLDLRALPAGANWLR